MSLIAPSNLLALQSYSGPSQARPQTPSASAAGDVFRPLAEATDNLVENSGRQAAEEFGRDDVTVNLSEDAVKHLDAAAFSAAVDQSSSGAPATALTTPAGGQSQDDRPAPPGSRLDITI